MINIRDKNTVFSDLEKEVAVSILNGMSISKCSKLFEIDKIRCQTILKTFCMKSNHVLYEELQRNPFEWPGTGKLRDHAEDFINDSKKLENVTIDSPIWALPNVPILTLNSIWKRNIYTIKNLLKHSKRDLLLFKYLGRNGLKKLILSLNEYGFSLKDK